MYKLMYALSMTAFIVALASAFFWITFFAVEHLGLYAFPILIGVVVFAVFLITAPALPKDQPHD